MARNSQFLIVNKDDQTTFLEREHRVAALLQDGPFRAFDIVFEEGEPSLSEVFLGGRKKVAEVFDTSLVDSGGKEISATQMNVMVEDDDDQEI